MSGTRAPKGDWVKIGGSPGEVAHCTRCGEGLRMSLPIRVEVFTAAANAFTKCHIGCREGAYIPKPTITPEQWVVGRDTGTSSLTIWAVMTGNENPHGRNGPPLDPDDFGRCYRLLKLFPAWIPRLPEVAKACPRFAPMIEHWVEMTGAQVEAITCHCGFQPKVICRNSAWSLALVQYKVVCYGKHGTRRRPHTALYATRNEAISAWNRRRGKGTNLTKPTPPQTSSPR